MKLLGRNTIKTASAVQSVSRLYQDLILQFKGNQGCFIRNVPNNNHITIFYCWMIIIIINGEKVHNIGVRNLISLSRDKKKAERFSYRLHINIAYSSFYVTDIEFADKHQSHIFKDG